MNYTPDSRRYDTMRYRMAGSSGLALPLLSLGLWHNFGGDVDDNECRRMIATAFDNGITHFDLANNYGPPPGSAEERFGRMLADQFAAWRDEMVIATKAGYTMWPGPYGDWGSRKYLIASCNASLRRMGVEYVDIFYHHRPDPNMPLEETMQALADLIRQGKALYAGISNYRSKDAIKAIRIMKELGYPLVLNQVRYSLLDRWVETDGLLDAMGQEAGTICFSPLAQGLLSDRYLGGTIPAGSRASRSHFLRPQAISAERVALLNELNEVARKRGESLSQMAIAWLLKESRVTSVLIGASSAAQILENLKAVTEASDFRAEELVVINEICSRWRHYA